jgi:hypothetical protein
VVRRARLLRDTSFEQERQLAETLPPLIIDVLL